MVNRRDSDRESEYDCDERDDCANFSDDAPCLVSVLTSGVALWLPKPVDIAKATTAVASRPTGSIGKTTPSDLAGERIGSHLRLQVSFRATKRRWILKTKEYYSLGGDGRIERA